MRRLSTMDLKTIIRDIHDFPKEGIVFKDITPILQDPAALRASMDQMQDKLEGIDFDLVVGPESRGFIFGVPMAYNMNKGFIPVRKAGKLPFQTSKKEYDLEYGSAVIEIHVDAIKPGQKVIIVDDLLATGGTSKAMVELIEEMGGEVVAMLYLIELEFLKGRDVLQGYKVESLMKY